MHKAISLSAELAEIRNAVEGARFLADELATGGLEDRKRELQAPLTISAILVLVKLRLHQVERVLRGRRTRCCCGRRTTTCPPSKPRMRSTTYSAPFVERARRGRGVGRQPRSDEI
jgi:hypothetical protein